MYKFLITGLSTVLYNFFLYFPIFPRDDTYSTCIALNNGLSYFSILTRSVWVWHVPNVSGNSAMYTFYDAGKLLIRLSLASLPVKWGHFIGLLWGLSEMMQSTRHK